MGNKIAGFIDPDHLDSAAGVLRALAHPLRLRIIEFIDEREQVNVGKIYRTFDWEQSITSGHLRVLRESKVVHTKRDGKFIYYSLNYKRLEEAKESVDNFLETLEH